MASTENNSKELTSGAGEQPPSRNGLVAILFGLAVIQGLVINLMPIMYPTIGREFGLTKAQTGLVGTWFFIGYTVALVITGYLVNYLGAKRVAIGGMVVAGGGEVLFSLANSYGLVLVAAALMGMGIAPLVAVYAAIISAKFSDIRQRMFMLTYGVFAGFAALGTFVVGGLVETISYRLVFIALGLFIWGWVALVFAVFGRALDPEVGKARIRAGEKRETAIRQSLRTFVEFLSTGVLTRGALYMLGFIVILDNLSNGDFMHWISTLFEEVYAVGNVGMALTVGALGVLFFRMAMGAFPPGWISDRILLGLCYGIAMITFIVLLVLQPANPLVAYVLVFVSFGFTGAQAPTTYSIATAKFGARAPAAIPLVDVIGNIGMFTVPWLGGRIADITGDQWKAMWLIPVAGFALVITVLLWELYDRIRGIETESGIVSEEGPLG